MFIFYKARFTIGVCHYLLKNYRTYTFCRYMYMLLTTSNTLADCDSICISLGVTFIHVGKVSGNSGNW